MPSQTVYLTELPPFRSAEVVLSLIELAVTLPRLLTFDGLFSVTPLGEDRYALSVREDRVTDLRALVGPAIEQAPASTLAVDEVRLAADALVARSEAPEVLALAAAAEVVGVQNHWLGHERESLLTALSEIGGHAATMAPGDSEGDELWEGGDYAQAMGLIRDIVDSALKGRYPTARERGQEERAARMERILRELRADFLCNPQPHRWALGRIAEALADDAGEDTAHG